MRFLRNLLAVVGLLTLVMAGVVYFKAAEVFAGFDQGSVEIYRNVAQRLIETGDPGMAMMWSVPVEDGLSPEDVIDSLKSIAVGHNLLFVGESPFYRQVRALTGEDYRYVNFLSFCDARIGKMMLEHRDQYSGFMPCRIALVEDKKGKLWLHTMNMDLMIHGGKELPEELKEGALKVRNTIRTMMDAAARGEF